MDSDDGAPPLPAEPVRQRLTLVRSEAVLHAVTQSPAKASAQGVAHAAEPAASEGKRKVR